VTTINFAGCRPTLSRIQKTRYALDMAHPLARIIDQLKREPSRTGSIVITVFGDAIVPRRIGLARHAAGVF